MKSSEAGIILLRMKWDKIKFYLCRLSLWAALSVLVPGVFAALLSGTPVPSSCISEHLGQEKKEYSSALLSSGNSLARLLRSSRQRNGPQGRISSTRSDGGEGESCLGGDIVRNFYYTSSETVLFSSPEEKCFWTNFINSALPVRAGPVFA